MEGLICTGVRMGYATELGIRRRIGESRQGDMMGRALKKSGKCNKNLSKPWYIKPNTLTQPRGTSEVSVSVVFQPLLPSACAWRSCTTERSPKWRSGTPNDGLKQPQTGCSQFLETLNILKKKRHLGEGVPQTKNEHGSNQKQRLNQHMVEI